MTAQGSLGKAHGGRRTPKNLPPHVFLEPSLRTLPVEAAMHLSTEEALDLIEKKASQAQIDFWNDHILTCAGCGNQLQAWQELRDRLHRQNLESAPAFVINAADAIFEPRAEKKSLREVIASVLFDSFS